MGVPKNVLVVEDDSALSILVGTTIERVELPAKIAAPRKGDDADPTMGACLVDELDRPPDLYVDV